MPRPRCKRRVEGRPGAPVYKPAGIPLGDLEEVLVTLDEMEAIRLADLEGLYHAAAAERMGVSRATFGRILGDGRRKVAAALFGGLALRMAGGPVVQRGRDRCPRCKGRPLPDNGPCPRCQKKPRAP